MELQHVCFAALLQLAGERVTCGLTQLEAVYELHVLGKSRRNPRQVVEYRVELVDGIDDDNEWLSRRLRRLAKQGRKRLGHLLRRNGDALHAEAACQLARKRHEHAIPRNALRARAQIHYVPMQKCPESHSHSLELTQILLCESCTMLRLVQLVRSGAATSGKTAFRGGSHLVASIGE